MRGLAVVLSILAVTFIVQYEAYYWNPCSGDVCLAIHCGDPRGCYSSGSTFFCADEACVSSILDKSGDKHLAGVWRVEWDEYTNKATVKKMTPVKSYRIK